MLEIDPDWQEKVQIGRWTAECGVQLEDEDGDLFVQAAVYDNLTDTPLIRTYEDAVRDLAAAMRWTATRLEMAALHKEARRIPRNNYELTGFLPIANYAMEYATQQLLPERAEEREKDAA